MHDHNLLGKYGQAGADVLCCKGDNVMCRIDLGNNDLCISLL